MNNPNCLYAYVTLPEESQYPLHVIPLLSTPVHSCGSIPPAENHIRPFVISRKNSLFNFTEAGAEVSAGWFTIVQTAKANGLNPGRYLKWLLSVLP